MTDLLKLVGDPVYIVLLIVIFWLMKMVYNRDKMLLDIIASQSKITTLLRLLVYGKDIRDD